MIYELLLILIVTALVYSGAVLATAGLIALGILSDQLPRRKMVVVQNGEIQIGDEKIDIIKAQPNLTMGGDDSDVKTKTTDKDIQIDSPYVDSNDAINNSNDAINNSKNRNDYSNDAINHSNNQNKTKGGDSKNKPDITPGDHYDEYDDVSTLLNKDAKYMGKIKNVVVDGANLIHYILGGKNGDYFAATETMIKMVCQLFPKKNIFITLKEPNDPSKITNRMLQKLSIHKIKFDEQITNNLNIDDDLNKYLKVFEEYIKLFSNHAKLHFVFGIGQDKARDDHTAILVTDLLGAKTTLLTRDRYRDIINITGSRPNRLLAFGPLAKKIQKKFDGYMDSFSAIGSWSIYGRILGYTCANITKTALWLRKPKNSSSSENVLLLGRDITDSAMVRLKKAKGNDIF